MVRFLFQGHLAIDAIDDQARDGLAIKNDHRIVRRAR